MEIIRGNPYTEGFLLIEKYYPDIKPEDYNQYLDLLARSLWYEEREIENISLAIVKAFQNEE